MSAALAIGQRAWVSARILWGAPITVKFRGVLQALLAALLLVALISWNPADPSLNAASGAAPTNWLGLNGALFADLFMQSLGLAAWPGAILLIAFGLAAPSGTPSSSDSSPRRSRLCRHRRGAGPVRRPLGAGGARRLAVGRRPRRTVGRRHRRPGPPGLRRPAPPGRPVIAGLMFLPLDCGGSATPSA